jgi:PAS domain S-box-containing protein
MLRETVTGQPRAAIARVPSAFVRVPATVAEWLAAGILAASTIGVVVALPNLRVDIGMVRFFYPFFGSVVAISHAVTALILFWRAELARERRVAVLGGTYLFAALLALANVLALPTSMSGANLFGPHAAAWYRVVGHLAWPLGIVIFAWMPGNRNRGPARPLLLALVAATIAIGFGVLNATLLPPLVDDRGAFLPAYYFAFAISSLLSVAAICSLLRRKPTSLELWVAMSVLFLLAETILSIRAGVRFSLGSYIGRGFGVASALVVFVALTGEYIALLRRANVVERFATIAEAAPVITFIVDNDGRCTFVNGRWTALTGQAANDAFGAGYRNVIDSGDLERVEAPWRMANRARHEFSTELRFYDAHTQRHRWHLIRSSALGDASGRVEAWLVTATDIDDQRRALDEARAAQLEFRRIAEAIPQIVWTARPNGMIDWANANWYAYSGLTTAASLDVAWRTVSHPDDRAEILSRWRDAVANGQPVEMEFRLLRKDGAYRWFLTRVVPVRDNAGTLVRWYGTSTDIDERRRQGDELTRLYEREHSVAKALQSAFLPPFLPDIPGIAFDAVYRPAARETEVGGDWYDAFLLPRFPSATSWVTASKPRPPWSGCANRCGRRPCCPTSRPMTYCARRAGLSRRRRATSSRPLPTACSIAMRPRFRTPALGIRVRCCAAPRSLPRSRAAERCSASRASPQARTSSRCARGTFWPSTPTDSSNRNATSRAASSGSSMRFARTAATRRRSSLPR